MNEALNGAVTGPHHQPQSAASIKYDDPDDGSRLSPATYPWSLAVWVVGFDPTE